MFIIFISFALLYTTISLGQTNSKLFIQYHLQAHFDVSTTAIYFSFILVSSRIARILGNVIFGKLYNKMKDKVNLLLPVIAMIKICLCFNRKHSEFNDNHKNDTHDNRI